MSRQESERPLHVTVNERDGSNIEGFFPRMRSSADIGPGSHLCSIHETDEDKEAVVIPFLAQGLEQGEKVVYVADAATPHAVLGVLRRHFPDLESLIDSGRLEVLTNNDSYLQAGALSPSAIIDFIRRRIDEAVTGGFSALRVTAEMSRALRAGSWLERLVEYEAKLSELLPGSACLALCQYDRRLFDPSVLLDVLRAHPRVVIGRSFYDNFYYVPPKSLLSEDQATATLSMWEKNLSEYRQGLDALRRSQRLFRELVEKNPDAILVVDGEQKIRFANQAAARVFERPVERLLGRPFGQAIIQEGHTEVRLLGRKGEARYGAMQAVEFEWEDGPAHLISFRDVTERKRMEEKLRRSEQRYRTLVDNIGFGVSMVSPDMVILASNRRMQEWFSIPDISEKPICYKTLIHPAGEDSCTDCPTRRTLQDGQVHEAEKSLSPDGQTRDFRIISFPLRDGIGKPTCAIMLVEDITERREADANLREAYRIINNSPAVAFLWKNEEGWPVEFVSENVRELCGYTGDEFSTGSVSYSQIIHPDDLDRVMEEVNRYCGDKDRTGFVHKPYRIIGRGSGEQTRWVEDITEIRRDQDGNATHFQGIVWDITSRRKAEQEKEVLETQLRQTHKMEAIGVLAGGIAHDFNNILGIISGFTELLLMDVPEDDNLRENLGEIQSAVSRAGDLTKQILTFSRKTESNQKPVDVGALVEQSVKFLRASVPATIEIQFEIITAPNMVLADPTQIQQILLNLGSNAAHAMPDGGVLRIAVEEVCLDGERATLYVNLKHGPYISITVSDTGEGMDPSVREKIFDPFFTTKGTGEGTGLGLAVVHGIVTAHKGAIRVVSRPSYGTDFEILLPRYKGRKRQESIPSGGKITRKARILFVDDEAPIVRIYSEMLRRIGHEVEARTSSIEAFEAFRAQPSRFDAVISDMTMPNMTGGDLAKAIRGIRKDVPIVLCTGFSEVPDRQVMEDIGIQAVLMKPVGLEDITDTLERLLTHEKGAKE